MSLIDKIPLPVLKFLDQYVRFEPGRITAGLQFEKDDYTCFYSNVRKSIRYYTILVPFVSFSWSTRKETPLDKAKS